MGVKTIVEGEIGKKTIIDFMPKKLRRMPCVQRLYLFIGRFLEITLFMNLSN